MHAASSFISLLHITGSGFRQNAGNHLQKTTAEIFTNMQSSVLLFKLGLPNTGNAFTSLK